MTRPAQRDCRYEPPYPEHETVLFLLDHPYLTAHRATERCPTEEPHGTETCGEWIELDGYQQ